MFTLSLILFAAALFVIAVAFTRGLLRADDVLQIVEDSPSATRPVPTPQA